MPPRPKRSVQHSIAKSGRVTTHVLRSQSRTARERRRRWLIFFAVATAILAILSVPAFGYWREVIAKGGEPIAEANGQSISTETYAKTLGFNQLLIRGQITRAQDRLADLTDDESAGAEAYKQILRQQFDNLRRSVARLEQDTLDDLIEGQLIRDEAARRGLSASSPAMDDVLRRMLDPSFGFPQPLPAVDDAEGSSDSSQRSLEVAQTLLSELVGDSTFLSPAEFRSLVQEPTALREILRGAFYSEAPTSSEQVRARHILVDTEEEANIVIERLTAGEDFADLASELSKDTSNKEKGGELGWFPRGIMVKQFEEIAFSLPAGQTSDPVRTPFGFHVIKVEEGPIKRALDPALLEQTRARHFDDWLNSQKGPDSLNVKRFFSADKLSWARTYVTERLPDL